MRKFKGIIFMLVFSIVFSYLAPIVKAVENYSNTTEKTTKTQQTQQVQKETEKEKEIAKQQIQDNEENENVIKQQSESTEEENKGVSQQGEDVEEEEIQFASEELKARLVNEYDTNGDGKLVPSEVKDVTKLGIYWSNNEPTDISGIENFVSLEEIYLTNCKNFQILTQLPKLKTVRISERIDAEELKQLENIKLLNALGFDEIGFNELDISNLADRLEKLSISSINDINLKRLQNFSKLTELNISYIWNGIAGLDMINNFTSLKKLQISDCSIVKDIEFLRNNSTIEDLDIHGNSVEDLSPIETMSNLKNLNCYSNNIKDISILETSNLINSSSNMQQSLVMNNVLVEKGKKTEIELPQTIRKAFDETSRFYMEDAELVSYNENSVLSVNSDKTKVTIDATQMDIGTSSETLYLNGNGALSNTSLTINFYVVIDGDKNQEIQFKSDKLKQYLLEHDIDIDGDNKITAFDMAQIRTLNLMWLNEEKMDLQGLEYATSLESLNVENAINYNVLTGLQNLKSLYVREIYYQDDYNSICNLQNLQELTLDDVDFVDKYDFNQLPKTLEKLEIQSSKINNIERINEFTNLNELRISWLDYDIKSINGLEKINELQNLKRLKLSLSDCKIENVDFLRDNESIEELDISDNAITNIDALETMKNLKGINISNNNIQDLSVVKRLNLQTDEYYSELYQNLKLNVEIEQGESTEIELPQLIKDMMNPDDEFYLSNLQISRSARFDDNSIEPIAKLNDENTKIILAPTTNEIGKGIEEFNFYGGGKLSSTSITINYTILGKGDKNKEVQFEDEYLKKQLEDYDNDGKITEFDMAQIKRLYLNNGDGIQNLKGLEYAKNLKELRIYIKNNYINGQVVPVDLSVLGELTNLKLLDISGNVSDLKFIENLTNLTDLSVYLNSNIKNIESIKNMDTLESLHISGQIETLKPLINLTNLKTLEIDSDLQQLKDDLSVISKITNLNSLYIRRYTVYNGEAKKFDYSFVKNLSNLNTLTINDQYLKLDCANLSNALTTLYLKCDELYNTYKIGEIKNLNGLSIEASKLKDIEFVKNLKLNWLTLENNLITDLSPLENCSAYSVNVINNPIDTKEEKNAKIIQLYRENNRTLNITDSEKTKNIDFENEEFKQKLVKEYDLNRDGEISIYEIEKIEYLSLESYIEKVEYLTNLKRLSFSNINLIKEEQEKLIKELDKLNSNVEVGISLVSIDLGKIKQNTTKEIDLNEFVPLLAEMQKEGSRLYQGKLILRDDYYNEENTAEYKNDKLILNTSIIGQRNYTVYYEIEGKQYSLFKIEVKWSNITDGDKSKEINIKDANFKKALLENYDIDGDKKFTENDAVNIGTLEISGYQIESLSGIENFKNLYSINAYNNYIADITPVMGLKKLEYANFYSNNITDITCLKNRKFKLVTALGIDGNYIDFSNNSVQVKTYLDEIQKDISKYGEDEYYKEGKALLASFATSQKIGKPTTQNNEVKMDSKIKAKLISLGADLNKDGKLTPKELRDATQGRYENGEYIEAIIESVDLSNLGLTSVEGIQYLSGLKEINLSHNKISDLTPLSYMMNLKKIDLSYNNITDISKLPNYAVNSVAAKTVNLSHNQIKDISCVKNWVITNTTTYCGWQSGGDPNFRVLDLDFSYNKIEDISAVKNYKTLAKLNLSHNNITDISSLKDYNFLLNEEIEEDNEWSEIREDLSNFKGIDLSSNYIDLTQVGNKSAIQVFKNKKVEINTQNQGTKLSFKDVPENEWYYEAVKYVYEKKIILGYNTTTFAPDDKITRGMLVTILYRMEGSPKVTAVSKFSDVQNTKEYYYNAVNWAVANNIVSGYSDSKNKGKFGPDDNITREQLAVILWKYSKYKGKFRVVKTDFSKFTDSAKISEYAKNGMNWALGVEVMHGSGGKLNPQGTASRAEAAAMLSNYCKNVK